MKVLKTKKPLTDFASILTVFGNEKEKSCSLN